MLTETFTWRGNEVRWSRRGSGPAVVLCHGTPWSSALWEPIADALSCDFTVHLWDMPGYGTSTMTDGQDVSLGTQGELLVALLAAWDLDSPHVVGHDYGGVVALRAHLLHGARFRSLALADVVALAPWGTEFLRLVRDNEDVFRRIPPPMHEGLVRQYVRGAAARPLAPAEEEMLVRPWLSEAGQAALYHQMAQADERFTDEVEPRYPEIDLPVAVVWGGDDPWLPVEQGRRLAALIPGAQLHVIEGVGHLVQLEAPAALTAILQRWLLRNR